MSSVEVWKPIPGYEGLYEASSEGRIRSVVRWMTNSYGRFRPYGGKVLRLVTRATGHQLVALSAGNVVKTHSVHRLVCYAFHGFPSSEKPIVLHFDGDATNNRPENLRWGTNVENEADKRRHDRNAKGERNPSAKLTIDDVQQIRAQYRRGSGRKLAAQFGISNTQLHDIVNRKSWDDGGNADRRARRGAA